MLTNERIICQKNQKIEVKDLTLKKDQNFSIELPDTIKSAIKMTPKINIEVNGCTLDEKNEKITIEPSESKGKIAYVKINDGDFKGCQYIVN